MPGDAHPLSKKSSELPYGEPDVQIAGRVEHKDLVRLAWARAKTQFGSEYAGSALGGVWHLLQPLAMIGIYTLVFGVVIRVRSDIEGVAYGLYLCSALVPWLAFQESITKGSTSFTRNQHFLRKLNVNELVFPLESGLQAFVGLMLGYVVVSAFGLVTGVPVQGNWFALIPIFLLLIGCGSGIGLACGSVVPFFPDFTNVVQIILRPMFWLTPVIYPLSQVGDGPLRWVVLAQPMTPFVLATRQAFFEGTFPEIQLWLAMGAWTFGTIAFGLLILRVLRHELRDVL